MDDERVIDVEIIVPGSPRDVWTAIATGPGLESWYVPSEVEERQGGLITMHIGDFGTDTARIAEWDPPELLTYVGASPSGGSPLTYRWTIEPENGDACTLRLVNSGFDEGDVSDADYEGLSGGWPIFLENLRLHLTHFRGRHARALTPTVMVPGGHDEAWATFCEVLDVPVDLATGSSFATSGEGVPLLTGIVEETVFVPGRVSAYLLLMDAPATGTAFVAAEGDGDEVACSVWLYLYDDAEEVEDRWSQFLNERWRAPTQAGAG